MSVRASPASFSLGPTDMVVLFRFPMPFWHSALMTSHSVRLSKMVRRVTDKKYNVICRVIMSHNNIIDVMAHRDVTEELFSLVDRVNIKT